MAKQDEVIRGLNSLMTGLDRLCPGRHVTLPTKNIFQG